MDIMAAAQAITRASTAAAVSRWRRCRYQAGSTSKNTICSEPQTNTRPAISIGRPNSTGSITASYDTPVGAGDLYLATTLSYRSKTSQFEIPNPFLDQDGFALLDASVVYTAPGNRWSVGIYGKNLLDKEYKTSGYTFVRTDPRTGAIQNGANGYPIPTLGPEGTLTAFYGNPRQVFASVTFTY